MRPVALYLVTGNSSGVPRRKKPTALVPKPPAKRDPKVLEELWGFPQRLAEVAKEAGVIDQLDLARKSGVSQGVISRIMNYKNLGGIRAKTIADLAMTLETDAGWLLLGSAESIPRVRYRKRPPPAPAAPVPEAPLTAANL